MVLPVETRAQELPLITLDGRIVRMVKRHRGLTIGETTRSYKKFNHFKVSGSYAKATHPRITITVSNTPPVGFVGSAPIVFRYKLTDTYATPSTSEDATMLTLSLGSSVVLYPKMNTTGPENSTSQLLRLNTNTTYYSQYLMTQIEVPYLSSVIATRDAAAGNIPEITIKFDLDEYETADI
jgi:hypothetical protein